MPPLPARPSAGTDRSLRSVTWPLLVITSLMLMLSLASILMLSWLRAYVNGEGLWSKAERQAVAELSPLQREPPRVGLPGIPRRAGSAARRSHGAARAAQEQPEPG